MNKDIGKKIKTLRQSKSMTLKILSEKSGLSIGFLSQLERGLTSVAIDCLNNIASVLDVDLTYFFARQKNNDSLIMKSYEQEVSQIVNSKVVYYHLSQNLEDKVMLPKLVTVLPYEGNEEIVTEYSHEGEEFIYVLEGILTLYVNNREYILYPEDCVHFNSSLNHNWINNSNKNVKMLVVNTPNFLKKDNLN
ncbi:helix-turn-helix domain-containing protein [Tepidibacter mesophilus]|uniref:helix-turn-helix domain-containing protein n=1 Tax=Tepidibacter mesophilus TaxID=655607 RepID=UPI000C07AF8C|nr:XRE family transcriptional regulator [Tepidibacter mesophilus]